MSKKHIAINIIAMELETNPESHAKIVAKVVSDPDFIPVSVMLCIDAKQTHIRWRELYNKYARAMAEEAYSQRL